MRFLMTLTFSLQTKYPNTTQQYLRIRILVLKWQKSGESLTIGIPVRQSFFLTLSQGSPSNSVSVTENDCCRTSLTMPEESQQTTRYSKDKEQNKNWITKRLTTIRVWYHETAISKSRSVGALWTAGHLSNCRRRPGQGGVAGKAKRDAADTLGAWLDWFNKSCQW